MDASVRIPVYLWYPARASTGHPMPYGDYLTLTQAHKRGAWDAVTEADVEAAADLPRGISQHALDRPLADEQWRAILERVTTARRDAVPLPGVFPLVLGGLNGAQSVATLAEALASHGYVVASGPMLREAARLQRTAPLDAVELSSEVLDGVFAEVVSRSFVDTSRVALVGVNFDGYTVLDVQMRSGLADAVVTLDGHEAKAGGTSTTRSLPYFDPARLRVPYLAFSMDVPEPQLRPDEGFFEDLRFADREAVVLGGVQHFHYIGDLLAWPHLREDVEPIYAAITHRLLQFLDAHVSGHAGNREGMAENGAPKPTYHRRWRAQPAPAIRLDGQISPDEWAEATEHELTDGGRVLVRPSGDDLYVAVEGLGSGWSHVYIAHSDTVHVLHASAALGTARYVPEGSSWRLISPFDWAVRDTSFSPVAEAERAAFFDREGWVASTNGMGSGRVLEFRIDGALLGTEAPRVAALFAEDPTAPSFWPASLADATRDADLVRGESPPVLMFDSRSWARLSLGHE